MNLRPFEKEHKNIPFEFKDITLGDENNAVGEFDGTGSAMFNIDEGQDIIDKGSFVDGLPEFLSEGFIGGLNHDWDNPIGSPLDAYETDQGLYVKGSVLPTQHGKDVRVLMKGKAVRKLSIGFLVQDKQMLTSPDQIHAYWKSRGYNPTETDMRRAMQPVRLLKKLNLLEISPVVLPMNKRASISGVKGTTMEKTVAEVKAQYLGDYLETSMTLAAISRLDSALYWYIWDCLDDMDGDEGTVEEVMAAIEGGYQEHMQIGLNMIRAILSSTDTGAVAEAKKQLEEQYPHPAAEEAEFKNHSLFTFSRDAEVVAIGVKALIDRTKRVIELRVKAGRTLSNATRESLKGIHQQLSEGCDNLKAMFEDDLEVESSGIAAGSPGTEVKSGEQIVQKEVAQLYATHLFKTI